MRRFPHTLPAAVLLAFALAPAAFAAEVPVRLVAPGDGAILRAGSTATLEWTDRDRADASWEEWEVFLSLDGGATYPVRLTPHLDRALRRVTFKVPAFPTRDARLLLRVGDEHQETAYELPERLAIAGIAGMAGMAGMPTIPESLLDLPRTVWRRGEPARPGEPGVVAWVEGPRSGGGTREVVAGEPARAVPGVTGLPWTPAPAALLAESPPSGAPAALASVPASFPPPRLDGAALLRTPRPESAEILLLLQRQNE